MHPLPDQRCRPEKLVYLATNAGSVGPAKTSTEHPSPSAGTGDFGPKVTQKEIATVNGAKNELPHNA